MIWIALDGKDAVGKTYLLTLLSLVAKKQNLPWHFLPEFSYSPVGDLIRGVLSEKRFFSLGPAKKPLIVAETLMLASDLAYQIETILPTTRVVISDRGLLSFVVYQALRLFRGGLFSDINGAIEYTLSILSPLNLKPHTILLTLGEEMMVQRIILRGEPVPSTFDLKFLEEVERLMYILGPRISDSFVELSTDSDAADLIRWIENYIRELSKRHK